ncbi:hypothetical protein FDP41_013679 [Naegleria fowleri]|uniref:Uncharacterized protein n=1 Tax=Naegleria fowleri TaxID=5763 RepID=A0A6A5C4R8_NAEFO|nr:uncharacterized protein FDP41_013679 [Naegleria fowleri]KAF0980465.1 hypothetical protein FDP41_013679 [Naegleria fowleri]CAG4715921.1 unnamed protein product [Naegleria fowleri]
MLNQFLTRTKGCCQSTVSSMMTTPWWCWSWLHTASSQPSKFCSSNSSGITIRGTISSIHQHQDHHHEFGHYSYSTNLISRREKTKKHFFNSGGGIRSQNPYETETLKKGYDGVEMNLGSNVSIVNKKSGYLDRKEKKHLSQSASRDSNMNRRRNSSKHHDEDDYDPFKPKEKKSYATKGPLLPVRNKYITNSMEQEFNEKTQNQQIQAPNFYANPTGSEQAVKTTRENVKKFIEEYKKSRQHHQSHTHHKEEHATRKHVSSSFKHGHQDVREEVTKTPLHDRNIRERTTNLEAPFSSLLNKNESDIDLTMIKDLDASVDIESLVSKERVQYIEQLLEQTEKPDFDKTAPKLSDEENSNRLAHIYFTTIAEYIEECLLEKLEHQDKMTDEEYNRYLSLERPYITSVNISPDYRTVTLNYKLLVREEIDEMNEEAYERDRQILEKVFNEEIAAQAVKKFIHYQKDILNDYEYPQHMKLHYKGIRMHVPTLFDEKPLPAEPGKRRQHINPYADMPHFTKQPFSGEKLFAKLEELGISIPE